MQALFICLAAFGLGYFLLAKRRFDVPALAFLSACVYFLPGFFGDVAFPEVGVIFDPRVPIVDGAYAVMIFVLAVILVAGIATDASGQGTGGQISVRGTEYAASIAVAASLVGLVLCLATTGIDALMQPDKNLVLEQLNRWYTLWVSAAALGFVMACARGYWLLATVAGILLALDVVVGFRSNAAIAAIGVLTIMLHRRGPHRLILHSRGVLGAAICLGLFMFGYKFVLAALKLGEYGFAWESLTSAEFYATIFLSSEPFYTQSILNEVVRQRLDVGVAHLGALLYQFLLFAPELGVRVTSFNELFQPVLFPKAREFGMAGNIWAEMLAAGGWLLLVLFTLIYGLSLYAFARFMRRVSTELLAILVVSGSHWAFYIHRNDILYEVTLLKQVLFLGAAVLIVSALVSYVADGLRSAPRPTAQY